MYATSYRVSVRGPVPADLGQKVAEAHVRALLATRAKKPAVSPAGHVEVRCDGSNNPH